MDGILQSEGLTWRHANLSVRAPSWQGSRNSRPLFLVQRAENALGMRPDLVASQGVTVMGIAHPLPSDDGRPFWQCSFSFCMRALSRGPMQQLLGCVGLLGRIARHGQVPTRLLHRERERAR